VHSSVPHIAGAPYILGGTPPAPGTDYSYTLPPGWRYLLSSAVFTLVTDANVANRILEFIISGAARTWWKMQSSTTQTASTTHIHQFAIGSDRNPTPGDLDYYAPLNPMLYIPGSFTISTHTTGIQAGDLFSVVSLYFLRWPEFPT